MQGPSADRLTERVVSPGEARRNQPGDVHTIETSGSGSGPMLGARVRSVRIIVAPVRDATSSSHLSPESIVCPRGLGAPRFCRNVV